MRLLGFPTPFDLPMASNDRYINIGMGLDIADLRTGLNDAKREMALADSTSGTRASRG